jgi:predicted RNA-binding protein with EMAP domain
MTLEDFQEYLNKTREELNEKFNELENKKEINKINSTLQEIITIQHIISYYINKSGLEKIPKIDQQKIKLKDFITMLKNRKEYLEEILNLK